MKGKPWLNKLQKFIKRRRLTSIWGRLAALQILVLLIFVVTWPPVQLTLVVPASEVPYWQSSIRQFEEKNRDIRISLRGLEEPQGDITGQLRRLCDINQITGHSLCDLIYADIIWVPEFAAKGLLMELSDKVTESELAELLDSDVAVGRYQGGLYRIPFRSDVGMLYYRQDLLEQAGIEAPETFQELLEISKNLQQQGLVEWGYLWQGQQYEGLAAMFVEVLKGYGGFWIDQETKEVGLDRKEAIAAVKFLIRTIDEQVSPPQVLLYSEDNSFEQFLQGNAAFLRNWPYFWRLANAEDSPLQGKVGIKPMTLHTTGNKGGGCKGNWGLAISKTSEHAQAAWKAIKYFTSVQAQYQFMLEAGYVPSRKVLFKDPKIVERYPHFPEIFDALKQSVLRPPIPQYVEASEILQQYLSAALRKQLTPEEAMSKAAVGTRQLLWGGMRGDEVMR
ncbi:MAG: ABC transporter substrate-binding protein [Coleofasciculaceae cyanobacterium]